jgi:hypothetical protein
MKVEGQFTIVIRGSVERTRTVSPSSWSGFDYLMGRLLTGAEVALNEFPHYGVEVEVKPGVSGDPWNHAGSPSCVHSWIEVTTKNDRQRRWICSNCDAEISKGR